MVEKASTFLMSCCAQAMVAATKAVTAPMEAITSMPGVVRCSSGFIRHSRYTPAVTMVAAWIRAETGVGPSMASGSQLNRGIWADLPVAARKRRSTAAVAVPPPRCESCPKMPPPGPLSYWIVPVFSKIRKMASRKPASPMRL